jgi:hypothetical protein
MHDRSKTAQYGTREIEENVRNRWYQELQIVNQKVGYKCAPYLRVLGFFMRVLDGSFLVAGYRRLFVVGRSVKLVSGSD